MAGVDLGSERSLGVRSDAGWERSRNRPLRSDDAGIAAPGGVAEGTSGRVSGDGKHGSLLDCSPRGVRGAKFASLAGGYATTGAVPGRDKKTDPSDCEWIQRLHSCGLLRGSFRPEEAVCMLRTLVRDKANLVAESGDWVRRMQKS